MAVLSQNKTLIAGALIGNVMEFFDFIIYVFLTSYITKNFFPLENEFIATILMFSVFVSGYLTRPFGALIFGYVGDRYGRKTALTYSIVLITLSTVGIGLLPVYSTLGLLSPLLLVLFRLIQGFAVSGEQSGAVIYLSETLKTNQKGLIGSLVLGSTYFGSLLGSLTCFIVSSMLSATEMELYGWRIPFLFSVFLGGLALYYRIQGEESEAFKQIKSKKETSIAPVKEAFMLHWQSLLSLTFLVMSLAVPIYMFTVYTPNYIFMTLGLEAKQSLLFATIGLLFISFSVPLIGRWADIIGNEKMLLFGLFLTSTLGYPIFLMLEKGTLFHIVFGQISLGIVTSFVAAPMFGVLFKAFPTKIRYTAISFVTNTGIAIFGSTVPIVSLSLIKLFENKACPGIYLALSGIIGLLVLRFNFFKAFFKSPKILSRVSEPL